MVFELVRRKEEFSESVFRPCFPKSLAGKTLLRLSAPPLRLSAPGGEGGVGREAKTLCSYLELSIELQCFFVLGFLGFLGFLLVSVWFPGFSACFCCFCLVS